MPDIAVIVATSHFIQKSIGGGFECKHPINNRLKDNDYNALHG